MFLLMQTVFTEKSSSIVVVAIAWTIYYSTMFFSFWASRSISGARLHRTDDNNQSWDGQAGMSSYSHFGRVFHLCFKGRIVSTSRPYSTNSGT